MEEKKTDESAEVSKKEVDRFPSRPRLDEVGPILRDPHLLVENAAKVRRTIEKGSG